MDAFEFNKIIGWVLAAVLIIFGGRTFMDLYNGGHGESGEVKSAYMIEVDESATEDTGGKKVAKILDVKPLLKTASIESGEKLAKKCKSCHTFEKGGKNKLGPALYDIVNRKVAGSSGFGYSDPLKAKGGVWDYDALALFLKSPKKAVPGTAMSFGGIKSDTKLADLIAYMRTKSDSPAKLPEPAPEKEAEDKKPAKTKKK